MTFRNKIADLNFEENNIETQILEQFLHKKPQAEKIDFMKDII